MQRYQREPFTPGAQFACVKSFVMAGVEYRTGDVVDTTAVEPRRLRQMYEARMIDALPAQRTAALLMPPVPSPASPQPPTQVRAEHRGFGRWFVIGSDGQERGPMTKDAAEALVAA